MPHKTLLIILNFVLAVASTPYNNYAQQRLQGWFAKDSIKLGEIVRYHVSLYHSKHLQVVFPGKSFSYAPFELVRKTYYPTHTSAGISRDSAIYELRTFVIKDTIIFGLPIYEISAAGDSSTIPMAMDTIMLTQLVGYYPQNDALKENTTFQPVLAETNYTYYVIVAAFALLFITVIFMMFRKRLVRRYKLYVLTQSHKNFIKNYEKLEIDFGRWQALSIMENALSLWKIYLSRLENSPINTYTTTEIISLYENEDLVRGLQIFDRSIYSGIIFGEPEKAFAILKKFSRLRFQKVRKESYG